MTLRAGPGTGRRAGRRWCSTPPGAPGRSTTSRSTAAAWPRCSSTTVGRPADQDTDGGRGRRWPVVSAPDRARRQAGDPRGDPGDELPRHADHQRPRARRDHRHRQPRRRAATDAERVVVAGPDAVRPGGADRAARPRRRDRRRRHDRARRRRRRGRRRRRRRRRRRVRRRHAPDDRRRAGRPRRRLDAGDARQRAAAEPRPRQRPARRRAHRRAGRRGPRRRPPPQVDSVQRRRTPTRSTPAGSRAATITNILLFILLQTYGQWVLTASRARRRRASSRCCWP